MSPSSDSPIRSAMKEEIYKEVGQNYRFLAKWRQLAFAGYLAVLAAAMSFTSSAVAHEDTQWLVACCFRVVAGLGNIFWLAARRTHQITQYAMQSGRRLEGAEHGFFAEHETQDATTGLVGHKLTAWLSAAG